MADEDLLNQSPHTSCPRIKKKIKKPDSHHPNDGKKSHKCIMEPNKTQMNLTLPVLKGAGKLNKNVFATKTLNKTL